MKAPRKKKSGGNIYLPFPGRVEKIFKKTGDVNLYRVQMTKPVSYSPGQFFMVSLWGVGEVPISIASLQERKDTIEFCIRKAGFVTGAIHSLKEGETLWLRGPYGNGFSTDSVLGRDVVVVAGGIGIVPLRPIIQWFIKKRTDVKSVTLLYGSRTPDDVVFTDEVEEWRKGGIKVVVTVDRGRSGWTGNVGLVTTLWHEARINYKESVAFICGPEIMIRAAMQDLFFFGMPDESIVTTLEAHMKCGIGKCGHCYASEKYVCTDGPVFTFKEIKEFALLEGYNT